MLKGLLLTVAVCGVLASSQHAHSASAGGGAAGGGVVVGGGLPVAPFALMACPALIVIVAFLNHHRELTAQEAWSCGLLGLFPAPVEPPLRVKG